MSVKITYFVHGTTTDNEQGLATGWNQGELSELGQQQSRELGEIVKDKKFDIVFSSDLKRAVDSAELAFQDKYGIIFDERLREINYGDWNGTPGKNFKSDLTKYLDDPFPGGESYSDVIKRIENFLDFLKSRYNGKHVAIVSHHAPQLALDILLNGKTWQQAIDEDWRNTKSWQPGWEYTLK